MQVQGAYDLIVIGDQLSGLFLAAGAAQAGRKVLVLRDSMVPTVSYEVPSGRFLGDFASEPVIGLEAGSKVDSFLRSLGLYQKLEDLFPLHGPPLQMVGPRFRFDFFYGKPELTAELKREFPSYPELFRLLSGSVVEKAGFSQAVEKVSLPVEFEQFGTLQAAAYGAMAPADLSYPGYKQVLSLAARSVRYPLGGRSALAERLVSRIKVYGGGIKRARVEEIVFERGRLAGVLLSSYEGFVRSPLVVGAMGTGTFFSLVPERFRHSSLAEAVKRIQPRFWRFSFTMLVPEDSLPEGMGSHLVIAPEEGAEFLQLQVFPKDVYGGIPARHRALVVRTLVPFELGTISETHLSRHMKRTLARVRKVMPFCRETFISPDPDRLGEDPAFDRYYRFKSLDHIPPVYLAYESGLSPALDQREYLDWSRFGLPGLAICSRDVYPLLGTTGEMAAAMDLLAVLGKKSS